MGSKDCSTCAYGERHEGNLFWCDKRGTALFDSRAFEKVTDCSNWTSKEDFKLGRCSECRFSVCDAEEDTFTCYCDHRALLSRPDNEKERENCSFCSPKSVTNCSKLFEYGAPKLVECAYTLTSLQHDEPTFVKVLEHTRYYAEWFTTNFPYGASSAEEVLNKLNGGKHIPEKTYSFEDFCNSPDLLIPLMNKGINHETWFKEHFPNGASSKEEVLNKIKEIS